jgi:2-polyprenyl-3-methyl-5-hydroxy-6-metoxy-1,4-benzoquinol methylase
MGITLTIKEYVKIKIRRILGIYHDMKNMREDITLLREKTDFLEREREKLSEEVHLQREKGDYLEFEVTRLSSIVRYLATAVGREYIPDQKTRESFDFQWGTIPSSRHTLSDEQFKKEAPGYVCQYTGFPPEWFRGKKILDVGCGSGRYSWALCTLGAYVTSLDQSAHGLEEVRKACAGFPGHTSVIANLREPLPEDLGMFDLVWSFGVLHHTGDTYGVFTRIAPLVRSEGFMFLMLYGEPRKNTLIDYAEVNLYETWREKTRTMSLQGKLDAIIQGMKENKFPLHGQEHIHGYFDAISPLINDLYRWDEIEGWLVSRGFTDIKKTVESRNHFVVAKKAK